VVFVPQNPLVLVKLKGKLFASLSRITTAGARLSLSTFLVLIALTFGQIAVLTVTLFVLWLAEEFRGSHE
jgi:hypothetical protein